jgi:hypothetical protein
MMYGAIVTDTDEAVAVAAGLSTTLVALVTVEIVVPAGMPAPVTTRPTSAEVKDAVAEVSRVVEFVTPSVTVRAEPVGAAVGQDAELNWMAFVARVPELLAIFSTPPAVLKVFAVALVSEITEVRLPVAGEEVRVAATAELLVAVPTTAAAATASATPTRVYRDALPVIGTVIAGSPP